MKKNSDLDDTKPIEIITDDILADAEVENETRSEKYKDITKEIKELDELKELEEEKELTEISKEEQEEVEKAEEALAEKNINEAEKIINEEKKEKEDKKPKKKTLKEKWKDLPKNKKIMIIILGILILALLIVLIVFFATRKPKEVEKKKEVKVEEEIKISDNYYYKEGYLYLLDDNDKELGKYRCKNKSEKKCYVAINNYRGKLDVPYVLNDKTEEKIERMPIYNNNYAFIHDDNDPDSKKIQLYSIKDKKSKETFTDAQAFDGDFIILENTEGKYGFYQFKESLNIVMSPNYDELFMIDGEDLLVARTSKGYVLLNKVGKELSTPVTATGDVKTYNSNFIVFQDNGKYIVYNNKGEELLSEYRFITVRDNYIFSVDDNNKLYIRDQDKAKYIEEGISLSNTDYVPSYVYDENGKLKKTKRAYTIEVNKASIEIMPYDKRYEETKNVSVNTKEGELSKTLSNYSYLNGSLYFYKDPEKENLIGAYKCNKVNTISTNNMTLQNCLPSSDTIFEDNDLQPIGDENRASMIPLYNSRYIFITDGSKNIALYDLIDKKTIISYTAINSYTASNENKLTLVDGEYNIVAVDKNNNYGVVTVTGSGIKSLYPFSYKHIEKAGEKYIGQKGSSWVFLDNPEVEYSAKIRGYNDSYVKTKDSSYKVADLSGKNINNNTYKYVELYDSFFAGVDKSNKLMIYDYDGDALLDKSLALSSSTYVRTDNPSFKITYTIKDNIKSFTISIYDGTKYNDTTVDEKTTVIVNPDKDKDKDKPKDPEKEDPENKENTGDNNQGE